MPASNRPAASPRRPATQVWAPRPALLGLAVFGDGWLDDIRGTPFSFWFFV